MSEMGTFFFIIGFQAATRPALCLVPRQCPMACAWCLGSARWLVPGASEVPDVPSGVAAGAWPWSRPAVGVLPDGVCLPCAPGGIEYATTAAGPLTPTLVPPLIVSKNFYGRAVSILLDV